MALEFNTDGLTGTIDIRSRNSEGWRNCHVAVSAFGFTAEYNCDVREEELCAFREELESASRNLGTEQIIEFCTLERGIDLRLTVNRRGHVTGIYEFARELRGPKLSGQFESDQTFLTGWASQLRDALES
jgi:hypothetical protein